MKTMASIEDPEQRMYVCENGAIKRMIEQIRTINASTELIRNHLSLYGKKPDANVDAKWKIGYQIN